MIKTILLAIRITIRVHVSLISQNSKTGPITVTTVSRNTCPPNCPLRKGPCYAETGKLAIHWRMVDSGKRGMEWGDFISLLKQLPRTSKGRYGQAGDLPGEDNKINREMLEEMSNALTGKRWWAYTHYPTLGKDKLSLWNATAIKKANNHGGLTVNVSCESLAQVDEACRRGLPAVVIVPEKSGHCKTPDGYNVLICPAQMHKNVSCGGGGMMNACGNGIPWCQRADRKFAVGFRAHGVRKRALEAMIG